MFIKKWRAWETVEKEEEGICNRAENAHARVWFTCFYPFVAPTLAWSLGIIIPRDQRGWENDLKGLGKYLPQVGDKKIQGK